MLPLNAPNPYNPSVINECHPFSLLALSLNFTEGNACPLCNTSTAKEIRASLFSAASIVQFGIMILPFALFAVIAALVYRGGFDTRHRADKRIHRAATRAKSAGYE